MTPFFRQSLTRALCAAAWGLPGALWWATPMVADSRDPSWKMSLPGRGGICGNAARENALRRSFSIRFAMARGEYADSLLSIAHNPLKLAEHRDWARVRLAELKDPRAPRRPDASLPAFELPPLIISP